MTGWRFRADALLEREGERTLPVVARGFGDALSGPLPQAYDDGIRALAVVRGPEVLEWRLPVRREEFAVRRGSGGADRLERADGTVTDLGRNGSADVGPGDVLVIETPGGGGCGRPSPDPHQAGEEIDDLRAF
ncbi:hypothetical protein SUDANB180_01529 [Streptomyces sp. enrichment culture]